MIKYCYMCRARRKSQSRGQYNLPWSGRGEDPKDPVLEICDDCWERHFTELRHLFWVDCWQYYKPSHH